jgi:cysteine synthase
MTRLGLETDVVDQAVLERAVEHFARTGVALPTLAQLADPQTLPGEIVAALEDVEPDAPSPLNLFRVHWHNGPDRRTLVDHPVCVVLPPELTGVPSPILVALGRLFPMIRAHKVLAAYGCLVPRLVTGQFDPGAQRAVWPSTGNYCRGGVAISRILGCRGMAVLPEGMSRERFEWLERWVSDPSDIVRTPGSESNVKEIYDECARLAADPGNVVLNQFCEFGNTIVHRGVTGPALERAFLAYGGGRQGPRAAAFVSATGSAGTIAAGDHLKQRFGTAIVAAEALECPTLLYNGYGEHNIQGIGDKHVPLIHNVMNTDVVVGVSDQSTDRLNALFNTDAGRAWLLDELGLSHELVAAMASFGLSSLCNVQAAIKTSKLMGFGPDDVILTVATDGMELYETEMARTLPRDFPQGFGKDEAAATHAEHLAGAGTEHTVALDDVGRRRIFNLGYFTWVEQQGVSLPEFEARAEQDFWDGLMDLAPLWDERIEAFNRASGAAVSPAGTGSGEPA